MQIDIYTTEYTSLQKGQNRVSSANTAYKVVIAPEIVHHVAAENWSLFVANFYSKYEEWTRSGLSFLWDFLFKVEASFYF